MAGIRKLPHVILVFFSSTPNFFVCQTTTRLAGYLLSLSVPHPNAHRTEVVYAYSGKDCSRVFGAKKNSNTSVNGLLRLWNKCNFQAVESFMKRSLFSVESLMKAPP